MPAGIEIYNADGSLQMDIGSRTFRLLTVQLVGGSNGSVSVPELASGTPVIGVMPSDSNRKTPTVTRSGNTVSWDYGSIPSVQRDSNSHISIAVY